MTLKILESQCVSFKKAEALQTMGFIQGCSYFAHIRNNCHKENNYRVIPVLSPGVDSQGYLPVPSTNCLDGYSAYTVHELFILVGAGTNAESLLTNMIGLKTGTSKFTLVQVMCDPDFIAQCIIDIHATGHLNIKEANERLKKYADESEK